MELMDIHDEYINEDITMEGLVTKDFQRRKQPCRCLTVLLGLLCAVLLAGNIGLLVHYEIISRPGSAEPTQASNSSQGDRLLSRNQLEDRLSVMTKERDQLQTSYSNMTEERDQLQTSSSNLQREKDQLQTSYNILQRERNQLQETINKLQGRPCKTGWKKFLTGCYFLSTVNKTWTLSRLDCIMEGADLVVINSRSEQVFVNGLLKSDENIWIGLTDNHEEGTWKWVDGTPASTTFWESGQPNSYQGFNQDCVETVGRSSGVGEWNDERCEVEQKYICEQ